MSAQLIGEDGDLIACWCGAVGTYDELFDDSHMDEGCGGLGVINCYCGGDLCVCHNHGETECFGCNECGEDDEYYDGDDW